MNEPDPLDGLLRAKFSHRLQQHVHGLKISRLSRITPSRILRNALPHVGSIELVSGAAFAEVYADLYESMFHGGERERSELIVDRLNDDFAGKRENLAPYRVVGIRDHQAGAVAAAQFSVLMLRDGTHAVPYLQYIYVRPSNRRQDMSELLHTLILAVASADADGEGRTVPFTLFETEPPCHGLDDSKRAIAAERTVIHSKSGSLALMVRRRDGKVLSAHVQPGLDLGDDPLTLVWSLRPSPAYSGPFEIQHMGQDLLEAYYQSLRDEGFPEHNIRLAERIMEARCRGCEYFLTPLAGITTDMYVGID